MAALLSSLSSALDALSTSTTALLLDSLPLLLHLYWLLAAGAVLFTLLPWDVAPAFKAAVRLSAARGKTMETEDTPTRKVSPSPSRKKRSRSRSRSRAAAAAAARGGSSNKATAATTTSSPTSSSSPSSSSPLGPFLSSLTVPQGWFLHFYALGSVVATAVLGAALRGGAGKSSSSLPPPSVAALALLLLHVLRRWGECSWQATWPESARMHSIAYAFGMSYYAVLPLSLVPAGAFGAAAAAVRGQEQAKSAGGASISSLLSKLGISSLAKTSPPPSSLQHPASLVLSAFASLSAARLAGVAVFAAGSLLQAASHAALATLQKRAAAFGRAYLAPGASDSRLLSLCACPHYLGEIVIYSGLALVAAGGFPSPLPSSLLAEERSAGVLPLLVLVWVSVNLALASAETKRWYRRRFPGDFPEERAALIPGVF